MAWSSSVAEMVSELAVMSLPFGSPGRMVEMVGFPLARSAHSSAVGPATTGPFRVVAAIWNYNLFFLYYIKY